MRLRGTFSLTQESNMSFELFRSGKTFRFRFSVDYKLIALTLMTIGRQ